MSQGLNGIGGTGTPNTWSQTQSFMPYYFPYQTAIRLLAGQISPLQSTIIAHYSSPDGNGLGIGDYPLLQVTGGVDLYLGIQAGNSNADSVASFNGNTGIGYQALFANTTGYANTAVGLWSLKANTTGSNNIAIGQYALTENTTGIQNTSVGYGALANNPTGSNNSAFGYQAMNGNSATGTDNCAFGNQTMVSYTSGKYNSVFGEYAGNFITSGNNNTFIGYEAGESVATGNNNVAVGYLAMEYSAGSSITSIGAQSLFNFSDTTNTPKYLTVVGFNAGYNYTASETNNIVIGYNQGIASESNMLRIGNPQLGSTYGQIAFSMMNLKGFGVSPIYGLDNRKGITVADSTTITLYTTSSSTTQVYKISARIFATVGTSATYVITWTESGATRTETLTVSAVDTEYSIGFLIQPDASTAISSQITSITSSTVNVATVVEEVA